MEPALNPFTRQAGSAFDGCVLQAQECPIFKTYKSNYGLPCYLSCFYKVSNSLRPALTIPTFDDIISLRLVAANSMSCVNRGSMQIAS